MKSSCIFHLSVRIMKSSRGSHTGFPLDRQELFMNAIRYRTLVGMLLLSSFLLTGCGSGLRQEITFQTFSMPPVPSAEDPLKWDHLGSSAQAGVDEEFGPRPKGAWIVYVALAVVGVAALGVGIAEAAGADLVSNQLFD
jgi:hypothetical protein